MAKTKPHTVRFEEKDFEFICKRERFTTAQNVVSFLLNEYIKLYKVEKKSVFDVKEDNEIVKEEFKFRPHPATYPEPSPTPINQFNAYQTEIKNSTVISQLEMIIREVKKDASLSPRERLRLEEIAKQHSIDNEFYND